MSSAVTTTKPQASAAQNAVAIGGAGGGGGKGGGANLNDLLGRIIAQKDMLFAVGILGLIAVLVLPVPTVLLDMGLALSITLSVLVLMVAIWIEKPLDFSSFPTVLLVTTMLRLGLELATTRKILQNGHEGLDAAGSVINGFASFAVGGDFVIGVVVFAILTVVNFMVITKGAGRIAEVAARFNLDAMPGKQMAIDADMNAGMITDKEARARRGELESESAFFGAMDGASKFVRGDAVAGIVITLVNAIGGIVMGTLRHNLSVGQAATYYTTLTIGDGLVSQIPALIISLGAGMLVTKGNEKGSANKAFIDQLGGKAKPMMLASALAALFGVVPGMPFVPFIVLSGAFGGGAWLAMTNDKKKTAKEAAAAAGPLEPKAAEEALSDLMRVDELRLELGMGLISMTNALESSLTEKIKKLRRAFALDFGFVLPSVRIKDNIDLQSAEYSIQIQGVEVAREAVVIGCLLAFSPNGQKLTIPGHDTLEPSFKIPARWIESNLRDSANLQGLTVVDIETVLTTHLSEIARNNMASLLTYAGTQKLLQGVGPENQKLVADLCPAILPMTTVQKVLSSLLAERVSIRHLTLILEAMHEAAGFSRNVSLITEHVRGRLSLQICKSLQGEDGFVPVMVLSSAWEREVSDAIVSDGADQRSFALAPSRTQALVQAIRDKISQLSSRGEWPALLTSTEARPFLRALVERINPTIAVISHTEVHQRTKLRTLDQIG